MLHLPDKHSHTVACPQILGGVQCIASSLPRRILRRSCNASSGASSRVHRVHESERTVRRFSNHWETGGTLSVTQSFHAEQFSHDPIAHVSTVTFAAFAAGFVRK